jgi:DNA end-binding protein Ku
VDEEKFERHMYHSAECKHPLEQFNVMTCKGCGASVPKSAAVKGVESNGEVILISDEELAKLVPQNEKTMKVLEYCEASEIDPIYFEGKPEFAYPDKGGEMTFAVMREFMKRTGKVAKGIRVKRGKEEYFVVRPYGQNGMTIHLLRADYEVRDASSLWLPVAVNGEAVELFAALAETPALTKPFTAAKRDQYLANANKLVEAKRTGKTPDCPTPEPEQSGTDDLLAKLKATLAARAAKAGK